MTAWHPSTRGEVPHEPPTWAAGVPLHRSHRPWSTALLTLHALGAVGGAGLLVVGVALLVVHTRAVREVPADVMYEPYALFAGVAAGVVGAVVLGAMAVLLALTVQGRRLAEAGRPRMLVTVSLVGAAFALLPVASGALSGDPTLAVLPVVLGAPYVLVAVRTAVVARS